MSKNSKFDSASKSLQVTNRNVENIIFQPKKYVLDSELNFISDNLASKTQDIVRSMIPSGWLDADYSIGKDNTYQSYGINTTDTPNTIYINSKKDNPSIAIVNGWRIDVGGSNSTSDNIIKIELNVPSSQNRQDLVFLEVWKRIITPSSLDGIPSSGYIWKYGNTQYGSTNPENEMINPTINFETTQRVQLQYRIRVVSGVNFLSQPYGVDDNVAVSAQGGNTSVPTSGYGYINAGESLDDYGLYIAGDGSDSARSSLKTIDGYVYAIPMFKIHRRNTGAYSIINQNGAGFSINNHVDSDRPDSLFYDSIDERDIEDLRHKVSFSGFNYDEILKYNVEKLFSGQLNTTLIESSIDSNSAYTNNGVYIDSITQTTMSGKSIIAIPNAQRRYFGDVGKTVVTHSYKNIGNKTSGNPLVNWTLLDQIKINIETYNPGGTLLSSNTPSVKARIPGSPDDSILTVIGTWTNLGTTEATFQLGTNPTLTNQTLHISYEIDFPQKGNTFTNQVSDIFKINNTSTQWGWISVNNSLDYREGYLPSRYTGSYQDKRYDYKIGSKHGIGTLIKYYKQGGGQIFTIPGIIDNLSVFYVYSVYNEGTASYISNIVVTRNSLSGELTVILPSPTNSSDVIRFELARGGVILEYDERVSSISDIAEVKLFEKTILNTQQIVVFETDDIVSGFQGYWTGSVFNNFCYFEDVLTSCTITYTGNLIIIDFGGPMTVTTGKVTLSALIHKTPQVSDVIDIYYKYIPYKGITKRLNLGTSSNDYILSKVVSAPDYLYVITNGTGAVNTISNLSKEYEPLIPKLPLIGSITNGQFTGTTHKKKMIQGGSYSATHHQSEYYTNAENYMTKENVLTGRGTYKGGRFTNVVEDGETVISKLIVSTLLEEIIEDPRGNFVPGELALKVETNYLNNTSNNKITNYDSGDITNSYDMYKIVSKPLVKKG